MAAGVYDITIEQGATFTMSLTWKDSTGSPVNLTGYTARMQVRENYESDSTLVSLTSSGGDIVLGGALGTIAVTIAATATQLLQLDEAVYDLELVNGATVTRLLQGKAIISREVTR
jgi:selenophosphate synthetase-related protein